MREQRNFRGNNHHLFLPSETPESETFLLQQDGGTRLKPRAELSRGGGLLSVFAETPGAEKGEDGGLGRRAGSPACPGRGLNSSSSRPLLNVDAVN